MGNIEVPLLFEYDRQNKHQKCLKNDLFGGGLSTIGSKRIPKEIIDIQTLTFVKNVEFNQPLQQVVVMLDSDCQIVFKIPDDYPIKIPSITIDGIDYALPIVTWSPSISLKSIIEQIHSDKICEEMIPLDYEHLVEKYPNVLPDFNPIYCELFDQFIKTK